MSGIVRFSLNESVLIIELEGKWIGNEDHTGFLFQVNEYLQNNCSNILCDCTQLQFLNSTGLNFFIRLLTAARKKGGDCRLSNLQGNVEKLFQLSKLNEIFTSFPTRNVALESFNK